MIKTIFLTLFFPFILNAQLIVAHRGASFDAPQNSIPAFELAWKQGADFIEGDFFLSSDNKVVCFHDKNTKKLTGHNLTVEKTTWAKLKELDIGYKKDKKWRGTQMPLLEDVLKTTPNGKGIFLEIKSGVKIVPFIKKIIESSDIKNEQVHIISFSKDVLIKCKELMPEIKTQWLISLNKNMKSDKPKYTVGQLINILKDLKADAIGTNFSSIINSQNIKTLQDAGFQWNVWTINDATQARSIKKAGVDFISTDRPEYIRTNLKTP